MAGLLGVGLFLWLFVVMGLLWADAGPSEFPLPTTHSQIAKTAHSLSAGPSRCDQVAILAARFTLAGFEWLFLYAPPTERYVFIQYPLGDRREPLRAFLGHGSDDAIVITRVIEVPHETVPDGPCSLLLLPEV